LGESPDLIKLQWAARAAWPALAAGTAGLALMMAVEWSTGQAASVPVVRYEPSPPPARMPVAASPEIAFMTVPTADQLEKAFRQTGYDLDLVRKFNKPVPRLRLATLPSGLVEIRSPKRRKTLFLSLVLPMVLEANGHIATDRRRLLYLSAAAESGQELPADAQSWLERLAARYKTAPDRLDVLLRRVDVVPVSLAISQAAIESGWGTSRFAQQGNAIFGQWTTAGGKGLVPEGREEGMTHKVRAFDRLSDSVEAYLLNLNTHRAYRHLRAKREEIRLAGERPDGIILAEGLEPYSQKGEEYVELLRSIIRVNRLTPFDDAILSDELVVFETGA
jgi:Bax protein